MIKAIELYLKVKDIADSTRSAGKCGEEQPNTWIRYIARRVIFNRPACTILFIIKYKDSIETLNKEKELTQVEATDEQQRQERLEKEKLEKKRTANNIQYMAITIGIAGLFVMLVVLGMFKVSATTIQTDRFLCLSMFFEFIFLIFKKNIYSITHGEPWKDLAFMIGLAAVLVPLHHWLEHKVIHYLTSHNRLTASGKGVGRQSF